MIYGPASLRVSLKRLEQFYNELMLKNNREEEIENLSLSSPADSCLRFIISKMNFFWISKNKNIF